MSKDTRIWGCEQLERPCLCLLNYLDLTKRSVVGVCACKKLFCWPYTMAKWFFFPKPFFSKAAKIPEPNSGTDVWLCGTTTDIWVEQGTREKLISQPPWFNFLWLSLSGSAGSILVPLHFLAGASWRMRLRTRPWRRLSEGFWRHHCWFLSAPQTPAEAALKWLQFQQHLWKRSLSISTEAQLKQWEISLCQVDWKKPNQPHQTAHRFYRSLKGKRNIFNQCHKIYIDNKSSRAPGNFHMSKLHSVQKGLHPLLDFNGSGWHVKAVICGFNY